MNLDELQSVQARERQSSDLQHLRSSFYREVGEYIRELTEKRAQLVERADDPFSSSEVRQLTDDIETAEQTVEAIYERRVGKVVKKASIAAAGMPVDDDGLTSEEETLFEDLVGRIENNRDTVLSVLDGDSPSVSCSIDETDAVTDDVDAPTADGSPSPEPGEDPTPDPQTGATPDPQSESPPEADGVSAADLMGSGPAESADTSTEDISVDEPPSTDPELREEPNGSSTSDRPQSPESDPLAADTSSVETPSPPEAPSGEAGSPSGGGDTTETTETGPSDPTSSERDVPGIPRTTVRITADVGEVVGADNRDYDLGSEDVVTLPEPNADVLIEKDAAERLE